MPLQATSGAASYDGFGGGVVAEPNYIESCFSTYLYTGNATARSIDNGIDLSTKGGLVWIKNRTFAGSDHQLFDTARGATKRLFSNLTDAEVTTAGTLTSFDTTGFSLGTQSSVNFNTYPQVSWTFRKQPKFFDVVTWTGNDVIGREIPHNLGSVPGCIMVKQTNATRAWVVYHVGIGNTKYLTLNSTSPAGTQSFFNNTTPTSTVFTVGDWGAVNGGGNTYVAYLFAHNAGGFGLTGTDNVISCGSFTTDGSSNATVTLGYEPQWVMARSTAGGPWYITDNMRGMSYTQGLFLQADSSAAEASGGAYMRPTATGFGLFSFGPASEPYIYIAIRRGPMKVPTSGTSVFGLSARTGAGANATVTGGQTDDAVIVKNRGSAVASLFASRLTGARYLVTSSTAADVAAGTTILQANPWDVMDGVKVGTTSTITNSSGSTYINYLFKRAPSFMDVVCYSGLPIGVGTIYHNLGVAPELIIVKRRNDITSWPVYAAPLGVDTFAVFNNNSNVSSPFGYWGETTPTSTYFKITQSSNTFESGGTFVAYLFATCAGVSKVFGYTGNGSSQTINCGFTSGARFVLIKRTDDVGDWYVWDSARGIVSGNDPHLSINSTAAEVTSDDTIDTDSTGFVINQLSATDVNVSSATYIGLAIA